MKKILFITTQYRVGERIYPVLPSLSRDFDMHLLKLYEMHPTSKWVGNLDMRKVFDKKYLKLFSKLILDLKDINYNEYDLILCDDDRARNGVEKVYKNRKCLMVGCSHGNRDLIKDKWHALKHHKVAFDKCFIFGKKEILPHSILGGIPSNDQLKDYEHNEKNHILIICNILGNHVARKEFKYCFNEHFFNNCGLLELQKEYNKKIIIKLKSRTNEKGYKHNIDYLNKILPEGLKYEILIDVEDDNKLVSESFMVISAPSTLTFKPIQLQIPTAVVKDSGQNGLFCDFKGFVNLNSEEIITTLKDQLVSPDLDFINNTIEGGVNFNSTNVFVNNLKQMLL
jgi:hypothetical protein